MKHASPYIFDIDGNDEFQQRVIEASHQQPMLVDFWADWCSPCLMLAPVLTKVIPEYEGRVLLAKIDADENMKLAGHYKLRGFPTIIMFVAGEEVARFGGTRSAPEVRRFIDEHMPL
jgi:thioredoxin 1